MLPELKKTQLGDFHSEKLPFLRNVIFLGEAHHEGMRNYHQLEKLGADVCDAVLKELKKKLDPHEDINRQYPSGTIGFPKGVMLTHYPHYVKFVDSYPMTVSGKIQAAKLRELAIAEYGLEEAAAMATA